MNHYELSFIISSVIPETEHKNVQQEILTDLEKIKAKIVKEPYLIGRKKLAYPIKKQKYGFYIFLEFNLEDKSGLKILDEKLKHNSNILRYLLIKKNPNAKTVSFNPRIEEKQRAKKVMETKTVDKKADMGVRLDNIDKQLDGLLEKDLKID